MRRIAGMLSLLVIAAGCGDQPATGPEEGPRNGSPPALRLEIIAGQDQSAPAGSMLPAPLVVRVVDGSGSPVAGRIVNFKVVEGGGTVFAGAAITNAEGVAQEWWTLGPVAGRNAVEARAVDPATGERQVFARFEAIGLTAVAEVAVSPAVDSVDVGGTVQLTAAMRDSAGNALTGRTVSWSSSSTAVATVSTSGLVTGVAAGTATITATVEGRSASAKVIVKKPATQQAAQYVLVKLRGDGQIAPPGTTLPEDPVLEVRDAQGSIVQGVVVNWKVTAGGGKVRAPTSTTGRLGRADMGWTLGSSGPQTLEASVSGAAAPVIFTATVASDTTAPGPTTPPPTNPPPTTPPPPPPPTNGAVFADDFEAGTLAAGQNGYRWKNLGVNVSVAQGVAHSGRYALRFTYPGKPDCQDATAEQRFYLPNVKEVWLEYYFYIPAGTEGAGARFYHREQTGCSSRAHNNKFLRLWDVEGNHNHFHVKGGFSFDAVSGGGDSWLYGQWGDYNNVLLGGQDGGNWRPAFTDALRGRWTQIRVHAKLASSDGAADGVLQLWADGVLKIDKRGLSWHAGAGRNNFFATGYLMGWSNSGYTQTTSFFIDDFRIYQQNPGW